jgi:hypothetical protein
MNWRVGGDFLVIIKNKDIRDLQTLAELFKKPESKSGNTMNELRRQKWQDFSLLGF